MLNNKALKWAYYVMLIGVLFYVIFESKRKQRAIPIVKPLRNQTIDFTRTIANMYYEKGKHKEMVNHKTNHLLEYIRVHFHLQTAHLDETFMEHLAARSNNSLEETKLLFKTIESFKNKTQINTIELEIDDRAATTVMLVSGGYPEAYEKDKEISGVEMISESIAFHAGAKLENRRIVTSGDG